MDATLFLIITIVLLGLASVGIVVLVLLWTGLIEAAWRVIKKVERSNK